MRLTLILTLRLKCGVFHLCRQEKCYVVTSSLCCDDCDKCCYHRRMHVWTVINVVIIVMCMCLQVVC